MTRPFWQCLAHGQLQYLFLLLADPIEIPPILRVNFDQVIEIREVFPWNNRGKNSGITAAKQRKNSDSVKRIHSRHAPAQSSCRTLPQCGEQIANFKDAVVNR
jgi:hypothetical protein